MLRSETESQKKEDRINLVLDIVKYILVFIIVFSIIRALVLGGFP